MILIDSNVPMYLVGATHPNKDAARRLIEASVDAGERLVTDAEVFQEILHRYVAINRRDAIEPAFKLLADLVDEVHAVDFDHVERARELVTTMAGISARDAVHLAVMQRQGIAAVMSFDRGFDAVAGIRRLG
ncbi:MAG: type II toxin-antitoxin system VapC family toxin [Chloroflexi bacterium]|nr:type II toxin-antitoxin system VapC family toxin [Chloroflexota bacterium]